MAASEANSKYKMERLLHGQPVLDEDASQKLAGASRRRVTPRCQSANNLGTWRASTCCRRFNSPVDRGRDALRQVHHANTAINKASFLATTVASAQHVAHHNPYFRSGRRLKNREIKAILNGRAARQAKCIFIAINPAVRFQAQ